MKLLFTEGVGAAQTTTNAQDEKIKIFASESDMLDNIDTLNENEIVATNDATEADLIGNMLTEIASLKEKLALSTTPDWGNAVYHIAKQDVPQTFTVPKNGFITWDLNGNNYSYAYIKVNEKILFNKTSNSGAIISCTGSCPVGTGDVVEYKNGYGDTADGDYAGTRIVGFIPYKGE